MAFLDLLGLRAYLDYLVEILEACWSYRIEVVPGDRPLVVGYFDLVDHLDRTLDGLDPLDYTFALVDHY